MFHALDVTLSLNFCLGGGVEEGVSAVNYVTAEWERKQSADKFHTFVLPSHLCHLSNILLLSHYCDQQDRI